MVYYSVCMDFYETAFKRVQKCHLITGIIIWHSVKVIKNVVSKVFLKEKILTYFMIDTDPSPVRAIALYLTYKIFSIQFCDTNYE